MKKTYPQLQTHNVFLSTDYRASFERIFHDHTLPDDPSFYVHAPARIDAPAAPEGEDTLMVLVPVGHLNPDQAQDVDALVRTAHRAVLSRLSQMDMADIEQNIKFEVTYSPMTCQKMYNLMHGAAFGLSHDFWPVGYLRPKNRHQHFHNLYFVGASTRMGTGLPIVFEREIVFCSQDPVRIPIDWSNRKAGSSRGGKSEERQRFRKRAKAPVPAREVKRICAA